MARRKFAINPGPLKVVKRKHLATPDELSQQVRCQAITADEVRCIRDAVFGGLCRQHGSIVARGGTVRRVRI